MTKPTTVREFFSQYPDDGTCLAHLFDVRFGQGHVCPKCERSARWYPLRSESAFSCQWCGHHVHPMVGTIFEKSRTPLQLWFYAIFLFTKTRHGVSAKELERQLGVTYKCAFRMAQRIRLHMGAIDGDEPLGGPGEIVEIDEAYVGGARKMEYPGHARQRVQEAPREIRQGIRVSLQSSDDAFRDAFRAFEPVSGA